MLGVVCLEPHETGNIVDNASPKRPPGRTNAPGTPWCNESHMCRFVIVVVWRGESRGPGETDTATAINHQTEEAGYLVEDGDGPQSMLSVCITTAVSVVVR